MTEKQAMRRAMRRALAEISPQERAAWSREIARRALEMEMVGRAARIMVFWAMPTEPDTGALIARLLEMGKEVYLPRVLGDGRMEAARLLPGARMAVGPYGIREPVGEAGVQKMDLVLAPGVAFDRFGGRLGHGAGYYDRFLEQTGAAAAGLAFEIQMTPRVPRDEQDFTMRRVVTQRAVYENGEEWDIV